MILKPAAYLLGVGLVASLGYSIASQDLTVLASRGSVGAATQRQTVDDSRLFDLKSGVRNGTVDRVGDFKAYSVVDVRRLLEAQGQNPCKTDSELADCFIRAVDRGAVIRFAQKGDRATQIVRPVTGLNRNRPNYLKVCSQVIGSAVAMGVVMKDFAGGVTS